jgi:RNA polymerase sigma factor (sigma-70 family)
MRHHKCLMQLSQAHREVMDLVYYHDKSVNEIAQIVGISPGTVKTRMFETRRSSFAKPGSKASDGGRPRPS